MPFEFSMNARRRNARAAGWRLSRQKKYPQDGLSGSLLTLPGAGAAWFCDDLRRLKNPLLTRPDQQRSTDIFIYNSRMSSESHAKSASLPLSYKKQHLRYPASHLARDGLYQIHLGNIWPLSTAGVLFILPFSALSAADCKPGFFCPNLCNQPWHHNKSKRITVPSSLWIWWSGVPKECEAPYLWFKETSAVQALQCV